MRVVALIIQQLQHIYKRIFVNLNNTHPKLKTNPSQLIKQILDTPWYNAITWHDIIPLFSFVNHAIPLVLAFIQCLLVNLDHFRPMHGVCLATSGLAICEYTHVLPIHT